MINKQKLYGITNSITPPVIFSVFKKSFLFKWIKKALDKNVTIQPKPHAVTNGILKNRILFFDGSISWQKEMIEGTYDNFFFDYLKKINLTNKTILDIGAHIGYTTLCFAELVGNGGKVLTFEPNPYNIKYIKSMLDKNPELMKRIQLFEIALSSNDGKEEFLFSDKVEEGMSSGSFIESADTIWEKEVFETQTGFKRISVTTMKMDSLEVKPDILKIDVEGAESLVLEGAQETIKKYSPLILLEIHSISNMYSVMNFFIQNNYSTELLKKEKDGRCFLVAKKQ